MKSIVSIMAVIGVAVLSLLALYRAVRFVFLVATRQRAETVWSDQRLIDLQDEHRRQLNNLREVQFDYETGKIDAADYEELRQRYERGAVVAMRAVDSHVVERGTGEVAGSAEVAQ